MKTAEEIVGTRKNPFISVQPDTVIVDALKSMEKSKCGSILVEENGHIIGVWTERDLIRNLLKPDFDINTTSVKSVMSTGLQSVDCSLTTNNVLDKFATLNMRHLLVKKNEDYIGIISLGDAVRANLQERTQKYNELSSFVSWEYYENWRRG